jgi:hypothetical protein
MDSPTLNNFITDAALQDCGIFVSDARKFCHRCSTGLWDILERLPVTIAVIGSNLSAYKLNLSAYYSK